MAVQAQYPSNILLPDFRNNRSGQEHRNALGLGFGSDEQILPQSNQQPQQPRMFNTGANKVQNVILMWKSVGFLPDQAQSIE